ncbi:MAG: hypothetical protein IJ297_03645, partial [Clostridia bacterium]|nr:hypothetical protein [Clostridia bacterium]
QSAEIYAKVWIGDYTSVETKRFTVTVAPVAENETDESLIYKENFSTESEMRGNFLGEGKIIDAAISDEFTISAFVRVDDLSKGGTLFNISGVKCDVNNSGFTFKEGRWYHIALTNSALYIDGEKAENVTLSPTGEESYIGAYWGKMDNFYVHGKAFSRSVINSFYQEDYNSPEIEIISAAVVEGMDSVIVKVASKGYEGTGCVVAFSNGEVTHSGYNQRSITEGVNVFTVSVPNMEGKLTKDNTTLLLWDSITAMNPLCEKHSADRAYDFGFDYTHPDNHMLNNTFTLMDDETGLYLTSDGLSQRTEGGRWSAPFRYGTNKEGYYSLVNENGSTLDGNFTFEQVEGNVYKIKNSDTGEYVAYGGNDKWALSITSYTDISKIFASEGFFLLNENERNSIYSVTGQALWQSWARREKLGEIAQSGYFDLGGEEQAQKLKEMLTYYPSYQINAPVNKTTTGVEVTYSLSSIVASSYLDMDNTTRSGYKATVTYKHAEGDVAVEIFARSQNAVKNIAKGFSFMPYRFIKPLKTVIDYNASNNQFKAETGVIYIETNYEVSSENVAVTGAHELGHLIDFAGGRISIGYYKTARENECSLSGYGDTALGEDFAEFCQYVISCMGDGEKLRQVKAMFPGRYNALCSGLCEMYGECILK